MADSSPQVRRSAHYQALADHGKQATQSAQYQAMANGRSHLHLRPEAVARTLTSRPAPLPFQREIQQSFGHHDVSGIRAHTGTSAQAATRAMAAEAFAVGEDVAFSGQPNLHTAAHEAAHVIQQRGAGKLPGGMERAADRHEHHADAVANLVVQGRSSERLLDEYAASDTAPVTSAPAVQRKIALKWGDSNLVNYNQIKVWLSKSSYNLDDNSAYAQAIRIWVDDDTNREYIWNAGQSQFLKDLLSFIKTDASRLRRQKQSAYFRRKGPWNNCGLTALNIADRLRDEHGASLTTTTRDYDSTTAAALRAIIDGPVTNSTFLDIAIYGQHEFTIEKQPGGRATLLQGYQGTYSAFWWLGLNDRRHFGQPNDAALTGARQQAGLGQQLPGQFSNDFEAFMNVGSWDQPAAHPSFALLPMHPSDRNLPTREPIEIKLTQIVCTNGDEVYEALGGDSTADFMGPLILIRELAALDEMAAALQPYIDLVELAEQERLLD
ncbi:MAG: DUF4157 domain-containing protein [Proteobacteria bacterium]|nr:DUF4157 domain-containing protein [Pseudomonadota bacterium]